MGILISTDTFNKPQRKPNRKFAQKEMFSFSSAIFLHFVIQLQFLFLHLFVQQLPLNLQEVEVLVMGVKEEGEGVVGSRLFVELHQQVHFDLNR